MLIVTGADCDIPGTLVAGILVAADITSAGVSIHALRTATTPLPTGNYHQCVLVRYNSCR